MQCLKPLLRPWDGQEIAIPCGQCHPCRIKRREEWTARIMLESLDHTATSFVTLTYSDQHLPGPSLCKEDHQRFLKRLRKRVSPSKIRFFCVGEYGERTERPHFHYALFGHPPEDSGVIEESWGLGFVTVSPLIGARARYLARYTTKKLTGPSSFSDGRCPEFAIMSRRPGLGREPALLIGRELARRNGTTEAPQFVSIGGKKYRLDRYIRNAIQTTLIEDPYKDEVSKYRAHAKARGYIEKAQALGGLERSEQLKLDDEQTRRSIPTPRL